MDTKELKQSVTRRVFVRFTKRGRGQCWMLDVGLKEGVVVVHQSSKKESSGPLLKVGQKCPEDAVEPAQPLSFEM